MVCILAILDKIVQKSIMLTRPSKDHDFATVARREVEQAIGENLDGSPLEESTKNPHAVALGRLGGAKGRAQSAGGLQSSNARGRGLDTRNLQSRKLSCVLR